MKTLSKLQNSLVKIHFYIVDELYVFVAGPGEGESEEGGVESVPGEGSLVPAAGSGRR